MTGVEITVAEVCERYVAAQQDARTAATYRSRLRSVVHDFGDLAAPDALRRLAGIEDSLADGTGEPDDGAHKAVTMLRKALGDAGSQLLTLVDAAKRHGIKSTSLRELVDGGRVRCCYRRRHGQGESILFDPDELAADLERLPRCRAEGCVEPGTGPSGYCGRHFSAGGRSHARSAEQKMLAAPRDWVTAQEAVEISGVSAMTMNRAVQSGDLPSTRDGRLRQIKKTDLAEWAERRDPNRGRFKPTLDPDQLAKRRERIRNAHREGDSREKIARVEGISRTTVSNDLEAVGVELPGKGKRPRLLPPDQRARRQAKVAELYPDHTDAEIVTELAGTDLALSKTQVARDRRKAGIASRAAAPRTNSPAPSERRCDGCDEPFTPEFPSHGNRHYCCEEHARLGRVPAVKLLEGRNLRGTRELAEEWGTSQRTIAAYITNGWLTAETITVPGALRDVHGVTAGEWDRFRRWWWNGGSRLRHRMVDPAVAEARAEQDGRIAKLVRDGRTEEDARKLIRGNAERRARDRAHARLRGGRPRAEHYKRWEVMFEQIAREIQEATGEPPTPRQVAAAVFEQDWTSNPETWPRDSYPPASALFPDAPDRRMVRAGTDRVLKAVL